MALTASQRAILDLAAARGEVVLAGNKESCAVLTRQPNGLWTRTDGEPMTGEQEVSQVTEDEVLRHIFWRAREMLGRYGPDDGSVTWDAVLAWLRESHI